MTLPPEGKDKPDADAFGRALRDGIGINLLVSDMQAALTFQTRVWAPKFPIGIQSTRLKAK